MNNSKDIHTANTIAKYNWSNVILILLKQANSFKNTKYV